MDILFGSPTKENTFTKVIETQAQLWNFGIDGME